MIYPVIAVIVAIAGWLVSFHRPTVMFFGNMLVGAAARGIVIPAIDAYAYARGMLRRMLWFVGIYLGLFLFFISIHWYGPALAMALVALAVVFGFAYICYQLQSPIAAVADRIKQWSERILDREVVLRVEFDGQATSATKRLGAGLINTFVVFPLNIPYVLTIGYPLRVLGGLAGDMAYLVGRGASFVRFLSRFATAIASYILTIALSLVIGMISGKHFLTIQLLAVLTLVAVFILMISIFKDWKFPNKGIPILTMPSVLANLLLLVVITVAVISPRPAHAAGEIMENAHNDLVKKVEKLAFTTSASSERRFRVTKTIPRTYISDGNGGFKKSPDNPVPSGTYGVFIGENNSSGPTAMTLVAFRDKKNDPDMVEYKSQESKLRWRWVPVDSLEEVESFIGNSPETGDSEPDTPDGWKEVARGKIDVRNQFSDIAVVSGKTLVQMWGKATIDSTQSPFGPQGWVGGPRAADYFPLPNGPLFGTVMKASDKTYFVGNSKEFDFPANTSLQLGPNDSPSGDGLGLQDNNGYWYYKISVPE